jgi:hypothetical protein
MELQNVCFLFDTDGHTLAEVVLSPLGLACGSLGSNFEACAEILNIIISSLLYILMQL